MPTSLYQSHHKLIDHIISVLFSAEKRRLAKSVVGLIQSNAEAYREQLDGFHYQGLFYRTESLLVGPRPKVLHQNLHRQMDAHLADAGRVKNDEQQIRQVLFKLLDPCRTPQDVRDALPECLTNTLGDHARLSRTRDEAFTIQGDDRTCRQYAKALPTIEVYSAARLLY